MIYPPSRIGDNMKTKRNIRTAIKYELTKEEDSILLKAAQVIEDIGYSLEENEEEIFEEIRNDEDEGTIVFESFNQLAQFISRILRYDEYEFICCHRDEESEEE